MISQVTVEIFALHVLEVLRLHVGEGVMLEISVDFVDFGLKLGNLFCRCLFWELNERSGRHDFGGSMEFLFALNLTLLFNNMFFN